PRTPTCSTRPSPPTCASPAPTPPTRSWPPPSSGRASPRGWRASPTGSTRSSASTAPRCRAGSASGSRWPGCSSPTGRSSSSTSRPSTWTTAPRRRSSPTCWRPPGTARRSSSPTGRSWSPARPARSSWTAAGSPSPRRAEPGGATVAARRRGGVPRTGRGPRMTTTDAADTAAAGALFCDPALFADMDAWHRRVAELRRETAALLADDLPGFSPFWVLLRHEDVLAVSRDNDLWHNTPRAVLGPDEDVERMVSSGMPLPASLVHLDGDDHRKHRKVTSDWFKPAAVRRRQPRIDEIADLFVERMRSLGGRCDFARDIAQPYTLRVIMDIYG